VRIAVIGASGDVGGMILPLLAEHHTVRTIDIAPPPRSYGEHVEASILDPDALAAALEGQDAVVCLAMGTKREWGSPAWAKSNLEINVVGVHLAARLATEAGVRTFVSASSMSIFADWFVSGHDESHPPDALDAYGLSKRLGEDVLSAAVQTGLRTAVSLRLFGPVSDDEWDRIPPDNPEYRLYTSASDIATAFLAALDVEEPGHHRLTITADRDETVLAWGQTRRMLDWQPKRVRQEAGAAALE
jgi:nucleoside-diphosphate-sugar epimerase